MKFSKLIKNGNKRQEMKLRRNAVLLSGLYSDIASSSKSPVVNNYFTPMKNKPTNTDELDTTLVAGEETLLKTPFRSSPLSKLFQFKSSAIDKTCRDPVANALAKQKLVECLLETPRIGLVGDRVAITPRVTKSNGRPKRLQRRAEYVSVRPAVYGLRSSEVVAEARQGMFTPLFKKQEAYSPKFAKNLVNEKTAATPSPCDAKPQSALAKLKKFVSKSALKVVNNSGNSRKSLGSACSSTSSLGADSDDSFANISMEQKRLNINLERLIDDEKQPKSGWSYQPINRAQTSAASSNDNSDSPSLATRVPKPNGVTKSARPCMGVSALTLKNLKAKNPAVSYAHCTPNMYLVAVPHVFNSEYNKLASDTKSAASESNYDHLARVNYSALKQKSKFQKNKTTCRLFASDVDAHAPSPQSVRISVFGKQKHLSAANLNESQQYDTIIF